MRKLIILSAVIILVPFFIIAFFDHLEIKEIKLNYITNEVVRIKREETGNIDKVYLEEYVVGVLAGEMPIYFEEEALKAQAVAARTYVLKRMEYNKDKDYDVVDSTINQVYLDNEYLKKAWGKKYLQNINKLRKVVNATLGEYLTYNEKIIDALFFSTSNGYTEDSALVFGFDADYLKSVSSYWDKDTSSAYLTTTKIPLKKFYEKLELPYSDNLKLEILERSQTNRINKLKINDHPFTGRELYNKLGLRSTDFTMNLVNENVVIKTKGYGHGVGMSQYGALGMAKEGYKYREILSYYYQNTVIKKI